MANARTTCIFDHPVDRVRALIGKLHGARAGGADAVSTDPGRTSITIDFRNARLPIRSATIEVTVEEKGYERTSVSLNMQYEPKYGVFGRAVSWLIMKSIIRAMLCRALSDLDRRLRAEVEVGRGVTSANDELQSPNVAAKVNVP